MVSTRSGRVVAPEAPEDVQVVDKPKTRTRRVGQTPAKDSQKASRAAVVHAEPEDHDDDDRTTAQAFKVASPVKVLTPKGGGLTPKPGPMQDAFDFVPMVQASLIQATPPAKAYSPAAQPPTRSLSVKDLVQEVSQMPLPAADVDDDDHNEAHYQPMQHRKRRKMQPLLLSGLAAVMVTVVVVLSACRGWPLPLSAPQKLQPACTWLNEHLLDPAAAWTTTQTQHAAATVANIQHGAARMGRAVVTGVQNSQQKGTRFICMQMQVAALSASAKWADLQQHISRAVQQVHGAVSAGRTTSAGNQQPQQQQHVEAVRGLPAFEEVLPAEALQALVLQEGHGVPHVADIYSHALQQQQHLHPKATGVIIACSTHCDAMKKALANAAAQPDLMLHVDGTHKFYSEEGSAGRLQQVLANFLLHNPSSVVVVSHLQQMHTECLAVLNNALSEGGSLQLHTKAASTTKALFVVLWEGGLPQEIAMALADQGWEQVESLVKLQLQQAIAAKDDAAAAEGPNGTLAMALRRRLEYVLVEKATATPAAPAAPTAVPEVHVEAVGTDAPDTVPAAAAA